MVNPSILARAAARSVGRPRLVRRLVARGVASSTLPECATAPSSRTAATATATNIYKRNMASMVTKTKTSDLPFNEEEDVPNAAPLTTPTYINLSDVLNVTPSCLNRVERLVQQRQSKENTEDNYFLRVYVDAGGCSGFTYEFEIDKELEEEEDIIVINLLEGSQPRVVVDETSLGYMKGSTLDFVQEMIKSAFEIKENPLSESACGCGSSFALKNFEANK
jgi:iron-sulfur cluster assembly accessory protein